MKNNKNRKKDREKSNPELRKMDPKNNADVGIVNGVKVGVPTRDPGKDNGVKG
jgi:hypothetical protein